MTCFIHSKMVLKTWLLVNVGIMATFAIVTLSQRPSSSAQCKFTMAIITTYNAGLYGDWFIVGPAAELAFREVRNGSLANCDFKVVTFAPDIRTSCTLIENNIAYEMSKLYYERKGTSHPLAVIFGTTCTFANQLLLQLLYYWNMLLIDGSSVATFIANKTLYPTFMGFSYTQYRAGEFFYQVVNKFNWTNVGVIYNVEDPVWRAMYTAMEVFKTKPNILLEAVPVYLTSRGHGDIPRAVQEAHKICRVAIVFGNPKMIRVIMLTARKLNYTSGDHIYIATAYFKTKSYFGVPIWDLGEETDNDTRDAYRSLFLVRQQIPSTPQFQEFDQYVKNESLRQFNYSIAPLDEVNVHAMGIHDAILSYAQVARETVDAGEDLLDGRNVSRRFTNRTFHGIRGDLPLDRLNNLNGYYELWNFQFKPGNFSKVVDFPESASVAVVVADIQWPSPDGQPPPNMPFCGFAGTNPACNVADNSTFVTAVAAAVGALGALCLMFACVCGKIRHDHALADRFWWRIDPAEVDAKLEAGVRLAMLRHQPVHLIPIKHPIIFTSSTVFELSKLRRTKCEKLVHILGILIEPDFSSVITEVCSRGTLYDLIRRGDLFIIDWNFRFSVLKDIVEITDYALHDIFPIPDKKPPLDDLLYVAPELLRTHMEPNRQAKRMADIYSFAIILSEVCLLRDPFYQNDKEKPSTTVDILDKIRIPLMRPHLEQVDFVMPFQLLKPLAKLCWSENPYDRLTAVELSKRFNSVVKREVTMVDDLLRRLTLHAEELEDDVAERTGALVAEKHKIQELLFEILPRSVALDLLSGMTILPETFESVTIMFTAVQGFGDIAAQSSPFDLITIIHNLYTMIDYGIANYDVYKVETVNDIYLIASGIPIRNGKRHVFEIAKCALYMREAASHLQVPKHVHMPDGGPAFLIGFHTGVIISGVIGKRMPRYCLFGDTINTASRMESTSAGGRIQLSESSMTLLVLSKDPTEFDIEPRGEIFVKGKGNMNTYWLTDYA